MTAGRHGRADRLARKARRDAAMARPELRQDPSARAATTESYGHDGHARLPVKDLDPATRALIDAALAKRAWSAKGATARRREDRRP